MSKILISVVSPVYNSARLVPALASQLICELNKIGENFEIILVDDRSTDESWTEVVKICALHREISAFRLSRNFGQHYAISAGLTKARGEWIVVMDCDLQDQPTEISKLLIEARNGFDIVLARRALRKDAFWKRTTSKYFYSFLSYLTGSKQDPTIANFGIYNKKVIAAINAMPDTIRYFPTMVSWVGFRSTKIDVVHALRPDGKSSYNFKKLMNLALDICLANSDKPLRLVVKVGFSISILGFIYAAYVVTQTLRGEVSVSGYASLLVSLWVLSGLIILIVGVVGLYVGKSFEGIKNRPIFLIDEILNNED
jgi:polyisoprenyl-phosphate glycosyltransferase